MMIYFQWSGSSSHFLPKGEFRTKILAIPLLYISGPILQVFKCSNHSVLRIMPLKITISKPSSTSKEYDFFLVGLKCQKMRCVILSKFYLLVPQFSLLRNQGGVGLTYTRVCLSFIPSLNILWHHVKDTLYNAREWDTAKCMPKLCNSW